MKTKIFKKSIKEGKQTCWMAPIEDHFHLQAMVSIHLQERDVGAYLLKKNKKAPWQFVFGFEFQGIHSFLLKEQLNAIFDQIEAGLKDFLPNESATFHVSAFKTDSDRQRQLASLVNQTSSNDLKFLLMGERQRLQQLAASGHREPKTLKIYVTYTSGKFEEESADWLEKTLHKAEEFLLRFQGNRAEVETERLEKLLESGFLNGFCNWEQILINKLKLKVIPLTAKQLWESLWYRFNSHTPAIYIPQLLILDENGLREEITSEVHSSTLLCAESVPRCDRKWIYNAGKYTAALTFWDKPAGWKDKQHQLHYLWKVIAQDAVTDTEIFCQISPANPSLLKTSMQRLIKQSTVAASIANERQDVDVAANIKAKRSIEAQESLYEGAVPFHTAIVFLVHRPTLELLDQACRHIQNQFLRPAWVVRDTDIAWRIWLQTLPIVQEKLLAVPFNRRQIYLTKELPGLVPLVGTYSPDRNGLELIAEDGGTPIHIDLFQDEGKHLGVFGTTRSGKSVLVSGILSQALARNIPVVALDYPKPDGTSTFTDYTRFVEHLGAYFDVGAEAVNLFDRPDLSKLPEKETPEETLKDINGRWEQYQNFLTGCLVAMVSGTNTDETLKTTIRSIISCILKRFFAHPAILERYEKAEAGGLGSQSWQKMPTLRDYLGFCTLSGMNEHLNLEEGVNPNLVPKALEQIRLQLTYWISSPIGKAIASPTTISSNAMLMVFALRQVSQAEDAAILSLIAYGAALNRAMASPKSIFFIDEAPILFEFKEIAALVAALCANGAKAGIRVIIAAQDVNTIYATDTSTSSKILQNLSTKLIGRIQRTATPSFRQVLQYPQEIISQCELFLPNKQGVFTQWLVDDNGMFTLCRYYPAYVQLGVVANNPDEQTIRAEFLKRYPDKYQAIAAFSQLLVQSLRSQTPLMELFQAHIFPINELIPLIQK